MPFSDQQKRIYATAPDDDYLLETLELRHSGFTGGVQYITNCGQSFQGTLEDASTVTFLYVPFASVPPQSAEENNLTLQVTISNASLELMSELEQAAANPTEKIEIVYRVFLNSDRSVPQNNPPLRLDVIEVVATLTDITFSAGLINLRNRPFPRLLYTLDRYPGLSR